jgi:hypothetical protein
MMQVEQIQAEIELLPQDKFIQLRKWFAEKDWEQWDEQLEQDVATGKLDSLIDVVDEVSEKTRNEDGNG